MSKKLKEPLKDETEEREDVKLAAVVSEPVTRSSAVDGDSLNEQELKSEEETTFSFKEFSDAVDTLKCDLDLAQVLLTFKTPEKSPPMNSGIPSPDCITLEASRLKEESREVEALRTPEGKETSCSLQNEDSAKSDRVKKTVRLLSNESIIPDSSTLHPKSTIKPSPSVGTNLGAYDGASRALDGPGENSGALMLEEAWQRLDKSYVFFKGKPVGTVAAMDPVAEALNYNQVYFFIV